MNIEVQVSFWISLFSFFRYIPRSGIAAWYGIALPLGFWETSILFSTAVAPIYIPTNSI